MADILHTISIVSFVAAGIFLAITIFLFFVFKIPTVFADLSGRTAKKSIEKMRRSNERAGSKLYDTGNINFNGETGVLKENYKPSYEEMATGLLGEDTELLVDEDATVVLRDSNQDSRGKKVSSVTFKILDEIIFIHTDEVI